MPHNIFRAGLLNIESRGVALSAAILAVSAVASRLLGVWRDWLLAQYFGAGADLDVYYAAFRIPDLIYNLLVFGGITVAFLPLFSDYYAKDKEEAWRFTNNTMNVFSAFLVLLCALLFVFTPQMVALVAPGFSPEQLEKTAFLSRIMFLSPIIFGIASIFSGVLQYFRRFLAYSLAALFYNAGIIAGIIFLSPSLGITGVGIGVIFGALLYLLVQVVPAIRCGFCYKPIFNLKDPTLGKVFSLMLPRTLGIASNQINLIVPTIIASTLAAGSIAVFNLSNNIFSLPVGIIGVSYATAAFASFSKLYSEGRIADLAQKFTAAWRQIGFLALPSAILIFMLSPQIVYVLYLHGKFSETAAILTSWSLMLFCLGIYFAAVMPLFFRLFFAWRDTVTPTLTTVVSVFANVAMNYFFVGMLSGDFFEGSFGIAGGSYIPVLGLALAYSVANALQFAMLVFLLWRKDASMLKGGQILSSFMKTSIAGIFMAVAVYLVSGLFPQRDMFIQTGAIALASLAGGFVYLLATLALEVPEAIVVKEALANQWNNLRKNTTNRK